MKYNLPIIRRSDFYLDDDYLKDFAKKTLSQSTLKAYEPFLKEIGLSSAESIEDALLSDQHPPELIKYNKLGELQNKIKYHQSYLNLKKASYGKKLISTKYDQKGLNGPDKAYRNQVSFLASFIFSQVDTGLFCPICMTDSLAWVLEHHLKTDSENKLVKESLDGLTSFDVKTLYEGAMFLTERQGGSDVGANTVEASINENGEWTITGHKWFCSNADAEVALVLARMPNSTPGTRGLGLFIFRKSLAKNYEIIRLKDKLGVRSMASGEINFNNTPVTLLSGAGDGFKQMAEMVNLSRIYNSIASLGVSRRAIEETKIWGEKRTAFQKSLNQHSLWQRQLNDLDNKFKALFELTFTAIKYLDESENGNTDSFSMFRVLTPVVKAVCGKFGVHAVSECMELIGGNAYIEEFGFAKLFRDVQVLPIWEGTTNIQALDLLRVFQKEPQLINKLNAVFKDSRSKDKWTQFKLQLQDLTEKNQLEVNADKILYCFCEVWLSKIGHSLVVIK